MQCKCSRTSFLLAARCATFVALVAPLPAHAQQFVLVDQTYTANSDNTEDSDFNAELEAGIPADFRAPTNYAEGSVHVDLEIMEAPSSEMTNYNICLRNSTNYACLPYIMYAGKGKHTAEPKLQSIWQYDKVDWTKGVTKVSLILKDSGEQKVQGNADFYPYKAHVTLTVVAKGSTFDPDKGTTAMGDAGSGGKPSMQGSGGSGGAAAGQAGSGGKSSTPSTQGGSGSMTNSGGSNAANGGKVAAAGGAGASSATAGVKAVQPPPTTTAIAGSGTPTSRAAVSGVDAGSDDRNSISSQLENTSGCSVSALGVRASSAWPWLALSVFALRRRKRQS